MRTLAFVLLFGLSGCTALRVFQTKVPEPVVKAPVQVEAERQAADLIAKKIETPVELKPVAVSLSSSLGLPKVPVIDTPTFNLPAAATHASADLASGIQQNQRQLDALNRKLTTLQGKDIEGTGISVLGPTTLLVVAAIVTLGIIFPPAFTFLFFAYRRLRQTTKLVVDQIDEASNAPETVPVIKQIKSRLDGLMDTAHKKVIHDLQKP